jgi:hypothetical protein
VGPEGLTIDARVHARRSASDDFPADGWAIVVYTGVEDEWLGEGGGNLGVNGFAHGYVLAWRFYDGYAALRDRDFVTLQGLRGEGNYVYDSADCHTFGCGPSATPSLDEDTVDTVEQRLRLRIVPDIPETLENELVVEGFLVTDEGAFPVPTTFSGNTAPVDIEVGDVLSIGVTSATGGLQADVQVPTADGFVVGCGAGSKPLCWPDPSGD